MKRFSAVWLSILFLVSGCAGLGVATVGAVIYYKSSKHEVATVNVKAAADKVFKVVMDTVNSNSAVEVTAVDDKSRLVEVKKENRAASIKVSELENGYSQLTISSDPATDAEPGTRFVLDGVFKICEQLKVDCTLSGSSQ